MTITMLLANTIRAAELATPHADAATLREARAARGRQ
jgi:hypothetical protein